MSTDIDPRTLYDEIATELVATSPTTQSKMFSMPCLKNSAGKTFAGFRRGAMVFKLAPLDVATALALPGTELFDPAEQGRAWKEWVLVPAEHASKWLELARAAFDYVEQTS